MWDRGILKANARMALRGHYWNAFGAIILVGIISSAFSIITMPINLMVAGTAENSAITQNGEGLQQMIAMSGVNSLLSLLGILYGIFVGYALIIGLARYFVHNHFGETNLGTIFSGFKREFMNGVGVMFVTNLFIFFWTLLLIIPGIVKGIQYSLMPYILSDNPSLTGKRARQISRILTNGEKGGIFVLWLSFLGWYLVGFLVLIVGMLFVQPYYEATMAELYLFLRDRAIQSGMINPAEFGLMPPTPPVSAPAGPTAL